MISGYMNKMMGKHDSKLDAAMKNSLAVGIFCSIREHQGNTIEEISKKMNIPLDEAEMIIWKMKYLDMIEITDGKITFK